jgi:arabinofuranan 3-O-arabinosyltransferase
MTRPMTTPADTPSETPAAPERMITSGMVTLALALVVLVYAAILIGGVGKPDSWIVDDKGQPTFTDFAALWGAGRLALDGQPAAAYDWTAHARAMSEGMGRPAEIFPFPYPPTFLALMAPLAALPYLTSLLAWIGLTLAAYLWTSARIVGRWEGAVWIGAMIVTLGNIVAGQNGFLTAALMGMGLLLLASRPLLAGILIGALAYKPHLGLLLPVALAAAGHWRAFTSATVTVMTTTLLALALFGLDPWWAFIDNLGRFGNEIATERFSVTNKLQSAYGFLATLGVPKGLAMMAQMGLTLALVAATAFVWRSPAPHALKAAWLAVASVLMSPYVYVYDLTLLAIGQAFLLRHWLASGLDNRQAIVLLTVNSLIVLMLSIKIPMGFLGSIFLMAAVLYELKPHLARYAPPTPA